MWPLGRFLEKFIAPETLGVIVHLSQTGEAHG
jgi:hypothetical protein